LMVNRSPPAPQGDFMKPDQIGLAVIATNPGGQFILGMGALLICPYCGEFLAGISDPLPFNPTPREWEKSLVNINLDLYLDLHSMGLEYDASYAICRRCRADLYSHITVPLNWETECAFMVPIIAMST
jgi:hypothetical protein